MHLCIYHPAQCAHPRKVSSFPSPILGLFLFTHHGSLSQFQRHGRLWRTTRKDSSRNCRQRWQCRRRAYGLSFHLPLMPGYRRSHFPLLTFGCVNWSSCCFYYAYLYYSIFLCARCQGEFSSLFCDSGSTFLFFIHPTPFLNHSSCYPFPPQQPTLVQFLTLMEHPDGRLQQQYLIDRLWYIIIKTWNDVEIKYIKSHSKLIRFGGGAVVRMYVIRVHFARYHLEMLR